MSAVKQSSRIQYPHEEHVFQKLTEKHQAGICKIFSKDGKIQGTGCLLSSRLLITCYHVFVTRTEQGDPRALVENSAEAYEVEFRHLIFRDGTREKTQANIVRGIRLDPKSYLAVSPNNKSYGIRPADSDHLDFVIIALKWDSHLEKIAQTAFFSLTSSLEWELKIDHSVCILHYPNMHNQGVQIDGCLMFSRGMTRELTDCSLSYNAATLQGSSGGAVLDSRGQFIGLHHQTKNELNYAVSVKKIVEHLKARGELDKILTLNNETTDENFFKRVYELLKNFHNESEFNLAQLDLVYEESLKVIEQKIQHPSMLNEGDCLWDSLKILRELLDRIAISDVLKLKLSKLYHVLLEINWYRYWSSLRQPIFQAEKNHIIQCVDNLIDRLPVELFNNGKLIISTGLKFYLSSIRAAAECLSIDFRSWNEYIKEISTPASFDKIYNFLSSSRPISIADWYPDNWKLNWSSVNVNTLAAFQAQVEPHLQKCHEFGKEYTLRLAIVYIEILRNPFAEIPLKDRAFEGLQELLKLKHENNWRDLVDNLHEIWNRITGQPNRFADTRLLTLEYLFELATQEKGMPYQEKSREIVLNWLEEMRLQKQRLEGELELCTRRARELEQEKRNITTSAIELCKELA
jgi:V8-like Glu-specific endopeptidase